MRAFPHHESIFSDIFVKTTIDLTIITQKSLMILHGIRLNMNAAGAYWSIAHTNNYLYHHLHRGYFIKQNQKRFEEIKAA